MSGHAPPRGPAMPNFSVFLGGADVIATPNSHLELSLSLIFGGGLPLLYCSHSPAMYHALTHILNSVSHSFTHSDSNRRHHGEGSRQNEQASYSPTSR